MAASPGGADSESDTARGVLAAATTASDGSALFDASELAARAGRVSRSAVRVRPTVTLRPRAVDRVWATAPLNVWSGPGERTERLGLVDEGAELATTGQRVAGFAEVLLGDKRRDRWVNARYLATEKPVPVRERRSASDTSSDSGSPSVPAASSSAPCPDGSDVESGITSTAVSLYRAVCAALPSLSTYGGYAPRGEHADGRAIDFMVTSKAEGDALAQFAQANAGTLGIRTIIFYQQIWTPERSAEGWRYMEDRGSPTANHMEHVHISVY